MKQISATIMLPWPHRVIAGAIGGFLPILVNLARIEPREWGSVVSGSSLDIALIFGYCAQGVLLAVLGAVVCVAHRKPRELWELLVLGMTAPALIQGVSNARAAEGGELIAVAALQPISKSNSQHASLFPEVSAAGLNRSGAPGAERTKAQKSILVFRAMTKETTMDRFVRGLFGRSKPSLWYTDEWLVVVRHASELRNADALVRAKFDPADYVIDPDVMEKSEFGPLSFKGDNLHALSDYADDRGKVSFDSYYDAVTFARQIAQGTNYGILVMDFLRSRFRRVSIEQGTGLCESEKYFNLVSEIELHKRETFLKGQLFVGASKIHLSSDAAEVVKLDSNVSAISSSPPLSEKSIIIFNLHECQFDILIVDIGISRKNVKIEIQRISKK